ncbi:potassium-dependent sodium-calcium exchanger-like protein [Thermincola potens JR]|uniref:Potassium-dependent sodium-calcium exchanger-like protein n=1 Tax=Thermincola potens (strain JR) TaxID=635013 RepID=D5XAH9_THEPJ|nr:potassium-dependent sodium-calcium exchanger-like protein [Thermincola potens JR]
MGRYGQILVSSFIGLACIFIGALIGNPIRPIHHVLTAVAFLCGFITLVLYFGWIPKTGEKMYMAIVIILTILFFSFRKYLF